MSGKRNRGLWREFIKRKEYDPPLTEQLRERQNLLDSVRIESYLEACKRAPDAAEGTKRKWKRALGL